VLQNPGLVILDEATSALDPTTEFLLLQRLRLRAGFGFHQLPA
jgi:ABC-type multidrug transport system fused ATPase/permease subunit